MHDGQFVIVVLAGKTKDDSVVTQRSLPAEDRAASWHRLPEQSVLERTGSSDQGLSGKEAGRRLVKVGPNELQEAKGVSPWAIFAGQFKSLIIWILIVAGGISGLLGEFVDAIAILAIVVLNAIIGFYQEFNAEKSITALRKMTAPRAKVRREGKLTVVPAREIVPGDVIELESGDLVAADARLVEAASLRCVESALTGESEAVDKRAITLDHEDVPLGDRVNMVFMGTSVVAGQGRAVVVATAMQTEMGHIAGLIAHASEDEGTPLQQKLAAFGRVLVWASLGIVALLFILGLMRGLKFFDLFMTSVSLAVAAVPEGLPAVVTIALALGVLRMSRRRALIRKLPAVETLGSTNVICTDKTGTLTVGEMTVRELYVAGRTFHVTGEGYGPHGEVLFEGKAKDTRYAEPLLELANVLIGCNNAHLLLEGGTWKVIGDPTEGALLAAGHKAGGDKHAFETAFPRHHEVPFDSDRKRRAVIRRMPDGKLRVFINGAPDELLRLSTHIYTDTGVRSMTEADRTQIAAHNETMAKKGLRVLGSSHRDLDHHSADRLTAETVERDLVFVGLAGMYDPPRPEVKSAVAKCHDAGIRVVMITGDHPHTALAIARELGIATKDERALAGIELDRISDEELRNRAANIAVYARVTAAHKLRIIRAWKGNGAVVAMTGDGVNDAPAVKNADIGIAMGRTGTEVTKQASDMIITDDNFASIVAAVEEGRGIYANIRKTIQYLLAGNCGELILMMACISGGWPVPLLPIHLLWINLATDGLPALCLASDPIDPEVMRRRPRDRSKSITDGAFLFRLLVAGMTTAAVSLGVFIYGLRTESIEVARSMAFTSLVFIELLKSFSFRSESLPLWQMPLFGNMKLVFVVVISFGLQIWMHHNAVLSHLLKTMLPPWHDRWLLLALALIPLVVLEGVKVLRHRFESGWRPVITIIAL